MRGRAALQNLAPGAASSALLLLGLLVALLVLASACSGTGAAEGTGSPASPGSKGTSASAGPSATGTGTDATELASGDLAELACSP